MAPPALEGVAFGGVTAGAVPPPHAGDGASLSQVIGGLMLVMLMAALDATIVSTPLPTIVGDLGGLPSFVTTCHAIC